MTTTRVVLVATLLVAAWSGVAHAQEDECSRDEECVELYAEGFICTSGSLGNYCVERGCDSDSDCREEYGEDSWCESWGDTARCTVPEPPRYVPPFRSMCGVAVGRSAAGPRAELLILLGLAAALARRAR